MAENRIQHLLQIAGIPASDERAAAWLRDAIPGARSTCRANDQRVPSAEHNSLLADIERTAKKLSQQIQRLRRVPASQRAFWRSHPFGPVYADRIEIAEVLDVLDRIAASAKAAKGRRKGRPRDNRKQQLADLAFAFFVRFSPRKSSGTSSGAFSRFAHEFYTAVTGDSAEKQGGLDRQIRRASATRLPIERARLQRKSLEKSRLSS